MAYYGKDGRGLQLPFNFALLQAPWRAEALAVLIRRYEALLPAGAWPNWVLGNHDRPRIASRIGPAQAAAAAMLLLTLRGTPTIYYGEELGMTDVPIPPELVQDPWEKQVPGHGLGRDPVRTPMPWDASAHGGFTDGTPWLPLGGDARARNVAAQEADPESLLSLYRALLALRRTAPALSRGDYGAIAHHGDVLHFERRAGDQRLSILLNLSDRPTPPVPLAACGEVLLSSRGAQRGGQTGPALALAGNEGVIVAYHGHAATKDS
jgi:alpha-glucosidase